MTIDPVHYARRWKTLAVLSLSLFIIGLDNTILNVALPTLQAEFDASASKLQWMVDSYLLVFAGLLLVFGTLGDRLGRKLALQTGVSIFGLASLGALVADSADQVIAVRALMGVGAALIMPATLSIIANLFSGKERGKAIGIWAGSIRLVDFMPRRRKVPDVVRLVEGVRGRVRVHMDLTVRFHDGRIRPWLRHIDGARAAIAGPESVWLRTPVETRDEGFAVRADFFVTAGELVPFVLTWHPSHDAAPAPIDPFRALADTESYWTEWVSSSSHTGEWREAVIGSLLTLEALTFAPTGGRVAEPRTSLPEQPLLGTRSGDRFRAFLGDSGRFEAGGAARTNP